MGTYTTNKNLFMPSVGEQGWGTLVNGNFETIDNFLKPISLSGSTYTFTGNHVGNQSGGSISATSISNSGTLTNTGTLTCIGKIYANGGIEGAATSLDKVITISKSSTEMILIAGTFLLLPHIPGVLYTGTIAFYNQSNNTPSKVYVFSESNDMSIVSLPGVYQSNGNRFLYEYTFSNIKCLYLYQYISGSMNVPIFN